MYWNGILHGKEEEIALFSEDPAIMTIYSRRALQTRYLSRFLN